MPGLFNIIGTGPGVLRVDAPLGGVPVLDEASCDVQITDAQIKALDTVPVVLVPAPSSGSVVVPTFLYTVWHIVVGYTVGTAQINVISEIGKDTNPGSMYYARYITEFQVTAGGLKALTQVGTWPAYMPLTQTSAGPVWTPAGSSIILHNAGGAPTDGDDANTLSVRIWYRTVPAGAF